MDGWIGILGTLIGVILGGGITLFVTKTQIKHAEKLDRTKRQLQKLEEAHEVLSKIEQHYRVVFSEYLAKVTTRLAPQENRKSSSEPIPFDRLKMLIGFYAGSLKTETEELIRFCIEEYGPLIGKAIFFEELSSDERKELAQRLTATYGSIKVKLEKLQSGLVELARNYH